MIIVTENNYKKFNDIENNDIPEKIPDIVFYPEIFRPDSIIKLTEILSVLNFNSSDHIWFSDNSNWIYDTDKNVHQFPSFLEDIRSNIDRMTGYLFNSCLISRYYGSTPLDFKEKSEMFSSEFISPVLFFGENIKIEFNSKTNKLRESIDIPSGSLLIDRNNISQYWNINSIGKKLFYIINFKFVNDTKKHDVNCTRVNHKNIEKIPNKLSKIYLNTHFREKNCHIIKNSFNKIHLYPEGEQCFLSDGINTLKKYITLGKLIGKGDWGNVYSAYIKKCNKKFALKMSRITKEDLENPYSDTSCSWYEVWMIKDIFRPLIVKNVCPNLPLFIDTFLCHKCDFTFKEKDSSHPCVITAVELANGDLRDYLKFSSPTEDELYSALFQIMAGLYAIQMSGQILNNDIKSKNILYYNVTPGGYWHYKIDDNNFYVPNYGKMFVLNDFGVSTLYNPNFQLYPNKQRKVFNLGSRYAINMDGIFSPIKADVEFVGSNLRSTDTIKWIDGNNEISTSTGATYKLDRKTGQIIISHTYLTPVQKSYLFRKGVSTNPKTWDFFGNPSIIPPFEFYNDTQDVLRTFVGGKRSTQKGHHILYPSVTEGIQNNIKKYLGSVENSKQKTFSHYSYHVLAGDFIKKFFTEAHNYTIKPKGKKISYYDMNKCLKL